MDPSGLPSKICQSSPRDTTAGAGGPHPQAGPAARPPRRSQNLSLGPPLHPDGGIIQSTTRPQGSSCFGSEDGPLRRLRPCAALRAPVRSSLTPGRRLYRKILHQGGGVSLVKGTPLHVRPCQNQVIRDRYPQAPVAMLWEKKSCGQEGDIWGVEQLVRLKLAH